MTTTRINGLRGEFNFTFHSAKSQQRYLLAYKGMFAYKGSFEFD